MVDRLIEVLGTSGYEVHRQGSLASADDYPDSYFTFWNNGSEDGAHYDNRPTSYVWDFDVNFYSTDVVLAYRAMEDALARLRQEGFTVSGQGYDVPSGKQSHIGRGANVLYVEGLERKG